jgi:hypothetical protein
MSDKTEQKIRAFLANVLPDGTAYALLCAPSEEGAPPAGPFERQMEVVSNVSQKNVMAALSGMVDAWREDKLKG